MKIGVISDTHGYMDARITGHLAVCDEVWHAGDIGSPDVLAALQAACPVVRAVHGNIDDSTMRRVCPELLDFETGGARVIMTHIGGYPGRYATGMRTLLRERRPTIFVSGHSHLLRVMPDRDLGLLHINPGAAGRHGWQQVRTLVRFNLEGGVPSDLEVIELA